MNLLKKMTLTAIITIIIAIIYNSSVFAEVGIITGTGVRVRKEASTSGEVLTNLYKTDEVQIIEDAGDWYKITYKEFTGYVSKDYVKTNKVEEKPQEVQQETPVSEPNVEEAPVNVDLSSEKKLLTNTNIYIIPLLSSSVIGTTTEEQEISIKETINNWSCVICKEAVGWVMNSKIVSGTAQNVPQEAPVVEPQIETPTPTPQEPVEEKPVVEETTKIAYINSASVNFRKEPSKTAEIIGGLVLNEEVTVLSEENGWAKVKADGKTGYVASNLISTTKTETSRSLTTEREKTETITETEIPKQANSNEAGEEVVEFAKSLLGKRYVLGAVGPESFDCSGFTYYVYKSLGYLLGRGVSAQSKTGTEVDKSELELGDLLLFTDGSSNSTKVGHVGIYIGNNKMVHAANPKRGVVTDTIASGYYYTNYISARRVI